eukprot:g9983.t1
MAVPLVQRSAIVIKAALNASRQYVQTLAQRGILVPTMGALEAIAFGNTVLLDDTFCIERTIPATAVLVGVPGTRAEAGEPGGTHIEIGDLLCEPVESDDFFLRGIVSFDPTVTRNARCPSRHTDRSRGRESSLGMSQGRLGREDRERESLREAYESSEEEDEDAIVARSFRNAHTQDVPSPYGTIAGGQPPSHLATPQQSLDRMAYQQQPPPSVSVFQHTYQHGYASLQGAPQPARSVSPHHHALPF